MDTMSTINGIDLVLGLAAAGATYAAILFRSERNAEYERGFVEGGTWMTHVVAERLTEKGAEDALLRVIPTRGAGSDAAPYDWQKDGL